MQEIDTWQDLTLGCVQCTETLGFVWEVEDQQYQKSQGWQNEPNKCKRCRDKSKLCTMFSQTGECRFGDMCRFSHTNDVKARAAPGSISKECEYFKNDNCSAGDMCPYTHSGRERQQNTEAVKLEKMKESEKENTDNLSAQGMGGLRRRMP